MRLFPHSLLSCLGGVGAAHPFRFSRARGPTRRNARALETASCQHRVLQRARAHIRLSAVARVAESADARDLKSVRVLRSALHQNAAQRKLPVFMRLSGTPVRPPSAAGPTTAQGTSAPSATTTATGARRMIGPAVRLPLLAHPQCGPSAVHCASPHVDHQPARLARGNEGAGASRWTSRTRGTAMKAGKRQMVYPAPCGFESTQVVSGAEL